MLQTSLCCQFDLNMRQFPTNLHSIFRNDKWKKCVKSSVWNWKKLKSLIYRSIQTLTSVLCWTPLSAVTASSFLDKSLQSLHTSTWALYTVPPGRLDEKHRWTAIFSFLHRCQGQSETCLRDSPASSWMCFQITVVLKDPSLQVSCNLEEVSELPAFVFGCIHPS